MMKLRSIADLLGDPIEHEPADVKDTTVERVYVFSCGSGSNHGLVGSEDRMTWPEFVDRISKPRRDRLTEEEFHDLTDPALPEEERKAGKAKQDQIKAAAGWYLPGKCNGRRRAGDTIQFRAAVTLDIDDATPKLLRDIERGTTRLSRYAFAAHETHKSTEKTPRIRLVVPLAGQVKPDAYPAVARAVARLVVRNLVDVDRASFEASRLMYWPSRPKDSGYWHIINDGAVLDPAALNLEVSETGVSEGIERGTDLRVALHNAKRIFRDQKELADCVRAIHNDKRYPRETWFKIAAAIAFESNGSEEGRALLRDFSERWEGGANNPEHVDETWDWIVRDQKRNVATKYFATGEYLIRLALADGYRRPIDGKHPPDEDGVCCAFEDAHKDQLRYDRDRGMWFVLQNGIWRPKGDHYAFYWARCASVDLAALHPGTRDARELRRSKTWSGVERSVQRSPTFTVESSYWDPDPYVLGTPQGVIDLRTGEVRDALPEDRITKLTRVAPIPLDIFDPERDCPLWLDCLDDWCNEDVALIRFIRQYAGYSLTGDVSEHKLIFIYGEGRNGKGTLQKHILRILGDYAVVANMSTFAESKWDRHLTELAALAGARLVVASETEEGRAWAEARLKACTGGDPITARFMRQDEFTFDPQFKLFFVGNHKPNLHNVDAAIKARLNIIPFNFRPKKPDLGLDEKLRKEWPAILSWMVQGCLDWQKHGLVVPKVVKEANADYFHDQDTLARWIEECCEYGNAFAATTGDLFESYAAFAGLRGDVAMNKNKSFPDELKKRGLVPVRDTAGIRGRGFKGIRIKKRRDDFLD